MPDNELSATIKEQIEFAEKYFNNPKFTIQEEDVLNQTGSFKHLSRDKVNSSFIESEDIIKPKSDRDPREI